MLKKFLIWKKLPNFSALNFVQWFVEEAPKFLVFKNYQKFVASDLVM